MREARAKASIAGAKRAVQELAWQADYLTAALRSRVTETAQAPAAGVETLGDKLRQRTSAHANDATYLPDIHFWLMKRQS